ncbi:MAG TPA: pilus assembly protein N-terminal domain-containing protein, partial [Methylophilaceae bacterium]|nr:pilus assembly protein N-terminal domain-containing protein [Methylophilaceae bacterium]
MPLNIAFISLMLITVPAFAKKDQSSVQPTVIRNMIGNANPNMCSDMISSPSKLTIPLGKSTLIKLPEPLASRTVGNADVLQAKMISPLTLYVVGLDIGSTNMILQSENGTCSIIDVTVNMDPDALQQTLLELMPEEGNIKVTAAGETLILSGTVQDATSANRALNIAQAYVTRVLKPVSAKVKDTQNNETENQTSKVYSQYSETPHPRVINMLSVGAQQQVMLEVKVAEISKTLLDKL